MNESYESDWEAYESGSEYETEVSAAPTQGEIRRISRSPMRVSRPRRPVFPVRPLPLGPGVVDVRPVWPIQPPETGGSDAAPGGYTPAQPLPPEGSEYVRWVQSSVNALLGLRLPLDGLMGAGRAPRDPCLPGAPGPTRRRNRGARHRAALIATAAQPSVRHCARAAAGRRSL